MKRDKIKFKNIKKKQYITYLSETTENNIYFLIRAPFKYLNTIFNLSCLFCLVLQSRK